MLASASSRRSRRSAGQLAAFGPSLLIISAGFDALEGDAGQLNPWTPDDPDLPPNVSPEVLDGVGLRPEDYGTMTRALLGVIPEHTHSVRGVDSRGRLRPARRRRGLRPGVDLVAAAVAHVEAL